MARRTSGGEPAPDGRSGSDGQDRASTRDRILDISLELFIEQGYDKTSLREIAERLGYSKAAVYYHFPSKEDILMALHMRLHQVLEQALAGLAGEESTPDTWARLLDAFIDQMLANRQVFLLYERNRAAFEQIHEKGHEGNHQDLEEQLRQVLADPAIALRARVRIACAFGAIASGVILSGDAFTAVPSDELGALLRDAVKDLLA